MIPAFRRDLSSTMASFRALNCPSLLSIFFPCLLFFASRVAAQTSRLVFAHYMLWAPLYTDDVAGFKLEIQLAQKYGIDAFALNTAVWDDEYQTRADHLYDAADQLNFSLFFSADMSAQLNASQVTTMLVRYAKRSSQLYYQGKQFFSTFTGQGTVFTGFSDALSSWRDGVLQPSGNSVFFVPFFVTDGSQGSVSSVITTFDSILSGLLAWDTSAWPYVNGDYNNPSNASDLAYLAACEAAGKVYMASVSPWFFAHEQRENLVKGNFAGAGLWMTHWKQLIQLNPPLVEIVTWNDWAERSYVVPVGTGWGAPAYNDTGFPHEAFLDLGSHYINWYKNGTEPAIDKEALYMFYYTQSKTVIVASDTWGPVTNSETLDDRLHAVVKAKEAGTVRLVSGGTSMDFEVGEGINDVSMPFAEGQQEAIFLRSDVSVLSLTGSLPVSNTNLIAYDFNVYSAFTQ